MSFSYQKSYLNICVCKWKNAKVNGFYLFYSDWNILIAQILLLHISWITLSYSESYYRAIVLIPTLYQIFYIVMGSSLFIMKLWKCTKFFFVEQSCPNQFEFISYAWMMSTRSGIVRWRFSRKPFVTLVRQIQEFVIAEQLYRLWISIGQCLLEIIIWTLCNTHNKNKRYGGF